MKGIHRNYMNRVNAYDKQLKKYREARKHAQRLERLEAKASRACSAAYHRYFSESVACSVLNKEPKVLRRTSVDVWPFWKIDKRVPLPKSQWSYLDSPTHVYEQSLECPSEAEIEATRVAQNKYGWAIARMRRISEALRLARDSANKAAFELELVTPGRKVVGYRDNDVARMRERVIKGLDPFFQGIQS